MPNEFRRKDKGMHASGPNIIPNLPQFTSLGRGLNTLAKPRNSRQSIHTKSRSMISTKSLASYLARVLDLPSNYSVFTPNYFH
jgi:hypothetical protein